MVTSETFTTGNEILIKPETARRNGCIVSRTGVSPNLNGEYIVKAGTPLYGTSSSVANLDRQAALSVTSGGAAIGVLYRDIKFIGNETHANGTLVINGEVDYLKLDRDVQSLITSSVEEALPHIQFTKGRAD